jgi:hypothetical protein
MVNYAKREEIWMHILFLAWYWWVFSAGYVLNSEKKTKTNSPPATMPDFETKDSVYD